MNDIHQGFQNVDQTAEAAAFFQFLDEAAALPSIQAYRQRMTALCPPASGQHILEVGCGIGHRTLQRAQRAPTSGLIVGRADGSIHCGRDCRLLAPVGRRQ